MAGLLECGDRGPAGDRFEVGQEGGIAGVSQRAGESGFLQWTNSVTNQADAKRILGRWARQLREGLDEATGGPRKGGQVGSFPGG